MDPVEEFSNTLAALLSVKPPGVSGTKIRKLTELAVQNVQVNIPHSMVGLDLKVLTKLYSLKPYWFRTFMLISSNHPRLIN